MQLEGNEHLNEMCNSDYPTNPTCSYPMWPDESLGGWNPAPSPPPSDTCTCGSPFVRTTGQTLMAGFEGSKLSSATCHGNDAFHDVADTNPFHLPHIFNSCSLSTTDCVLNVTTVTMPMYESGDDNDDFFTAVTTLEMRTKLKSREALWDIVGDTVASSNQTDGTSICQQINQASLEWALATAGADAKGYYESVGEPLVIVEDTTATIGATGPEWIADVMKWTRVNTSSGVGTQMEVGSWDFIVNNINKGNVPWYITAGYHYCKILSPARAMEWIYVDSLRQHAALATPSTAACEACLARLDPVGLSPSSTYCSLDAKCYTVGDSANPCSSQGCTSKATLSTCKCDSCNQNQCVELYSPATAH